MLDAGLVVPKRLWVQQPRWEEEEIFSIRANHGFKPGDLKYLSLIGLNMSQFWNDTNYCLQNLDSHRGNSFNAEKGEPMPLLKILVSLNQPSMNQPSMHWPNINRPNMVSSTEDDNPLGIRLLSLSNLQKSGEKTNQDQDDQWHFTDKLEVGICLI